MPCHSPHPKCTVQSTAYQLAQILARTDVNATSMLAQLAALALGFGSFPGEPKRAWFLASTGMCEHQAVTNGAMVPDGYLSGIVFDFYPSRTMQFTDAPYHESSEVFGLGRSTRSLASSDWDHKNIAILEPVPRRVLIHAASSACARISSTARAVMRIPRVRAQARNGSEWAISVFEVEQHGPCPADGCIHCMAPPSPFPRRRARPLFCPRRPSDVAVRALSPHACRHGLGLRPHVQF